MKKLITLSVIFVGVILFTKCNNADTSSKNEIAKSQDTVVTQATCLADSAWFPTTPAPLNFNPDSLGECGFYKWAWQEFLYVTQPSNINGDTIPRFLKFETPTGLFGVNATPLFAKVPKNKMLLLSPRLEKDSVSTSLDEVTQAGSNHFLVDKNGRVIYYAQHINEVFANFVRKNGYTDMEKLIKADSSQVFPVGSLELKSSWKIVMPGDDVRGFYTTKAMVAKFVNKKDSTGKTFFVVDPSQTEEKTVALLGLHVVGIVEGHPEFIWATFEHSDLAPNLKGEDPNVAVAVDSDPSHNFLLYKTGALAKDCNKKVQLTLDETKQTFSPITSVFHQFAFDETASEPDDLIEPLNKDVHVRLLSLKSVWANYSFKGAVWINNPKKDLTIGKVFSPKELSDSIIFGGEKELSNVTMETFTQEKSRCFSCHRPAEEFKGDLTFPAKLLGVSHVLTNAYFNSQQQKINFLKFNSLKSKAHK